MDVHDGLGKWVVKRWCQEGLGKRVVKKWCQWRVEEKWRGTNKRATNKSATNRRNTTREQRNTTREQKIQRVSRVTSRAWFQKGVRERRACASL